MVDEQPQTDYDSLVAQLEEARLTANRLLESNQILVTELTTIAQQLGVEPNFQTVVQAIDGLKLALSRFSKSEKEITGL